MNATLDNFVPDSLRKEKVNELSEKVNMLEKLLHERNRTIFLQEKSLRKAEEIQVRQREVIGTLNTRITEMKAKINIAPTKGVDEIIISLLKDGDWEIITHQGGKPQPHHILGSDVNIMWNIIKLHPIDEVVKSRVYWKELIKEHELGPMSPEKFFGSRRLYQNLFNYPVKILEAKGLIEYRKSGRIIRLKEVL